MKGTQTFQGQQRAASLLLWELLHRYVCEFCKPLSQAEAEQVCFQVRSRTDRELKSPCLFPGDSPAGSGSERRNERKERAADTLKTIMLLSKLCQGHVHLLCASFKYEKSLYMPLVFTTLTQKGHSEGLQSISMLFSIFTKCKP